MGEDDKIVLNILNEIQDKHGYISENLLKQTSEQLNIPIARLWGVVNFHTMLRTKKQGKYIIELCGSPSCVLSESREIENFLKKELNIDIGETTTDGLFSVYKTSCIGCCNEAPAMLLNNEPYTNLTTDIVKKIIEEKRNANSKRN
ncbi:MAG: NAD(P)H-dependent oxidoreductase subunit E [Candidatus Pacearchaeota archaeon]